MVIEHPKSKTDIIYPGYKCSCSPTGTHWFIPVAPSIWRCKFCGAVKWLPIDWEESCKFSASVKRLGVEEAYKRALRYKPDVRKQLLRLQKNEDGDQAELLNPLPLMERT